MNFTELKNKFSVDEAFSYYGKYEQSHNKKWDKKIIGKIDCSDVYYGSIVFSVFSLLFLLAFYINDYFHWQHFLLKILSGFLSIGFFVSIFLVWDKLKDENKWLRKIHHYFENVVNASSSNPQLFIKSEYGQAFTEKYNHLYPLFIDENNQHEIVSEISTLFTTYCIDFLLTNAYEHYENFLKNLKLGNNEICFIYFVFISNHSRYLHPKNLDHHLYEEYLITLHQRKSLSDLLNNKLSSKNDTVYVQNNDNIPIVHPKVKRVKI